MSDPVGPGEAARRLGVSTRTVQRWLREGRLPQVQVGSRVKVDAAAFTMAPDGTSVRKIGRLLVANRGELVVRIARTCRQLGIATLALAPEDQARAWWTSTADEIVPLAGTYLDFDRCGGGRGRGARGCHSPWLRLPRRKRRFCRGSYCRRNRLGRTVARGNALPWRQGRRTATRREHRRPDPARLRRRRPIRREAVARGKTSRLSGAGQAKRGRWRQRHARSQQCQGIRRGRRPRAARGCRCLWR